MSEVHQIFDRALLRRRRDRVAENLEAHAFLLDRFADDILDRLAFIERRFARVLVIGAHHGAFSARLSQLPGVAFVVSTETSQKMLDLSRGLRVMADEEALPFAEDAFDLVIGALTLQFVNDLPGALVQIRRILRPDGLFLGGILGGGTLQELRRSWLEAESEVTGGASPRVAPFADVRDLGGLLQRAGFALPVADADLVRVRYGSPLALMQDVKAMGAGNVLADRRRVPVGRRLLLRAAEIYAERFGEADGRIPATFEILTMTAWAPHESQQKPLPPGSAQVRLADALQAKEHRLPGTRDGKP